MNRLLLIMKGLGSIFLCLIVVGVPLIGQFIATGLIVAEVSPTWKKVCWGLVVWAVPYAGPFAYLVLGRSWPYKRFLLWPVIIGSLIVGFVLLALMGR